MALTAKKCAESVDVSRQTVQAIFGLLAERVEALVNGKFPEPEVAGSGEVMSPHVGTAVKMLKESFEVADSYFALYVTFDEFQNYRKTGQMPESELNEDQHFYRYTLFRTLYEFSTKTYGINKKTYPKYFAFCKYQFLLGLVIIELDDAGHISVKEEGINAERSFYCFQILLLSIVQKPLNR